MALAVLFPELLQSAQILDLVDAGIQHEGIFFLDPIVRLVA